MSDLTGTETENTDKNWEQARKKIANLEAQVTKLKSVAVKGVAKEAGFDPNEGVTKLLLEKFEATIVDKDEFGADDFKTFAKELGVDPPTVESQESTEDKTNEQQMENLQNAADGAEATVDNNAEPPTPLEDAWKAAEGNVASEIAVLMSTFDQS